MPYDEWSEVNKAIQGIEPRVTLAQANIIADWADAMEDSDDGPDNPWAAAIAQFKKLYEVDDGKWAKRPSAQASFTCECLECGHIETLAESEHCADMKCPKCGGQMRRLERPGQGAMSAMQFACNTITTVRHETVGGVEYLVAPVVAIREGVLKGEFVSAEEIEKSVETWNGRPFVIGHPKDEAGRDITANDPKRLAGVQAGQLFNARFEDQALKAELWVDVSKAKLVDGGPDVMSRLENGEPLEVSTAYWRDSRPKVGSFRGRSYATAASNLRPDHIAGLLDKLGACSWADGCGAPRVNEGGDPEDEVQVNALSKARTPVYDGTTSATWEAPSLEDYLSAYPGDKPDMKQVSDLPAKVKSWIAQHTLLGDSDADNFRNLSFFPVVTPGGKLNEGALRAVLGGRAAQAKIPEAAKMSAQNVARRLLEDKFDMEAQEQEQEQEQVQGNGLHILQAIARTLGIEIQEDKVMANKAEMIKTITGDGRLELNDEDLEEVPSSILSALVKALNGWKANEAEEEMPDEESAEDPEPEGNERPEEEPEGEPEANEEQEPEPCANAMEQKFAALEAEVEALRKRVEADDDERKAELVSALAANAECAFGKDRLKAMSLGDLELLHRSLSPADYSGQGGGPVSNEVELTPYNPPDVLSPQEDK